MEKYFVELLILRHLSIFLDLLEAFWKPSMAKEGEEYLTAEELRNRLYHSLRDRGLVNSMKVCHCLTLKRVLLFSKLSLNKTVYDFLHILHLQSSTYCLLYKHICWTDGWSLIEGWIPEHHSIQNDNFWGKICISLYFRRNQTCSVWKVVPISYSVTYGSAKCFTSVFLFSSFLHYQHTRYYPNRLTVAICTMAEG